MANSIDDNRLELNSFFSQCIQRNFLILQTLGFRLTKNSPGFMQYESEHIALMFYYERLSYEIYASVLSLVTGFKFSIDDFLILDGKKRQFRAATSPPVIEKCVLEMRDVLVSEQGKELLCGITDYCNVIEHNLLERLQKHFEEAKLGEIEKKAHAAWLHKDYHGVIKAYKLLGRDLTAIQKKRLELAEKAVQNIMNLERPPKPVPPSKLVIR